jgi:low temperature requirement protein LtrA
MGVRVQRQQRPARWLVPPRLRTTEGPGEERHASWLELFFDLVFVVAIAELAQQLEADPSTGGLLRFAALFVPVYVAWQGFSIYADRFDTDDVVFRLALFAGMLAIASLAVQIEDVVHGRSTGFAVAYIALRSIMLALYGRAWRAVPAARPLIARYGIGYSSAVAIWVLSLAFPSPVRYVLWGLALALDLSLPPLSTRLIRRVPTHGGHVVERWGLFTLIVLGESVVVVALGVAGSNWQAASATAAIAGFVAVAAVWWLYFDRLPEVRIRGSAPAIVVYSYGHLPLLMGLAAMGAGLGLTIEHAQDTHLGAGESVAYLGGAALFLLAMIVLRTVMIGRPLAFGIMLKISAATLLLVLAALQGRLPTLVLAAAPAVILATLLVIDRARTDARAVP